MIKCVHWVNIFFSFFLKSYLPLLHRLIFQFSCMLFSVLPKQKMEFLIKVQFAKKLALINKGKYINKDIYAIPMWSIVERKPIIFYSLLFETPSRVCKQSPIYTNNTIKALTYAIIADKITWLCYTVDWLNACRKLQHFNCGLKCLIVKFILCFIYKIAEL